MQTLQKLIDLLAKGSGLHICVLDLSGVLNTPATRLVFANTIHAGAFCDLAKSTERGYRACMRCKRRANARATEGKLPFVGLCQYGLFEAAFPVVIDGITAAVVYAGRAIRDEKECAARLARTCRLTGAPQEEMTALLPTLTRVTDGAQLLSVAELVGDYLRMLIAHAPREETAHHWLVEILLRHADEGEDRRLTLAELAATYQCNETYLGRLFKREMGVDFHTYCTKRRLEKARARLLSTEDPVLEIALDCGFASVSYFNRIFRRHFGMTPTEYRREGAR